MANTVLLLPIAHVLRHIFLKTTLPFFRQIAAFFTALLFLSRQIAAFQRDGQHLSHPGGSQVRQRVFRPRHLLYPLRDQLRDQVQDLRGGTGRARLQDGDHEEVRGRHK